MRFLFRLVLVTSLFFAAENVAKADGANNYLFGTAAAACVPADPAIQSNLYTINAGSVFFSSSGTGLVTLYCPVSEAAGQQATSLDVTYVESDGTTTTVQADAQLIGMNQTTGVPTIIATFLSSANADTVKAHHSVTFTNTNLYDVLSSS